MAITLRLCEYRSGHVRSRITTANALNDPLPETIAAERLRQHLEDVARERDNAYRALQEREAELARIQRIGKVGGVEVDFREGFKNRRSPEYLMLHGLPPEAADESHEDWINRIHPDDRDATVKHFIDALSGTSEDYTAEYRIIRPSDGEIRWIRVVAKIERDGGGRAIRLVGAHIDITDQMLARETLRESEERFRLIADSAPVPIWVTKLDRTRSFANQAYVDFVGLPYDQAIDFDWRKVLHPDDLPHVLQQSVQGEASLKPFVLEARYKNAAGEWRWLRSESQPRWDRPASISASSASPMTSPSPSRPRSSCGSSTRRWKSASSSAPPSSNPTRRGCARSWRPATSIRA